jgi:glycosyltransferase involved in cell wall biosynthesis
VANVSVIIPCYNAENTIEETVKSVLAQTYQDFEVIVVDDGSTDQSREIVESFGKQVKLIKQDHSGRSSIARNTGIKAAGGNYFAFVDADDLWLPTKLDEQLTLLRQEGTLWCYCDVLCFRDADKLEIGKYSELFYTGKSGWMGKDQLLGNRVCSPSPLVHRDIINHVGGFDESLVSREDWDLWLRISFEYPVSYVNKVLARYRVHEKSKTYAMDPGFTFKNHQTIIEKIAKMYPEEVADLRPVALAHYAFIVSKTYWLINNYASAQEMAEKAKKWAPRNRKYKLFYLIYKSPPFILNTFLKLRKISRGL